MYIQQKPMNKYTTDSSITEDTSEVDVDTNGSPHQSHTTIGTDTVKNVNNDSYASTLGQLILRDGYPRLIQ